MPFKPIFPLVFALSILCSILGGRVAAAQSAESKFHEAVSAFKKGDLKQAKGLFLEVLDLEGANAPALFNLGLIEQKSGRSGMALGLWRKALVIQPEDSPTRAAIDWAKSKLERSEIPHEVELWESLRDMVLSRATLDKFLFVSAALLLAYGWLLLRYFGRRRQALLDERPLPAFPAFAVALAVIFVFSCGLSLAKAIDMKTVRGTILVKKIEARSAPETTATPLFELYEGLEVIVKRVAGDWVQVTYPGAASGWVPKSSLFTTIDKAVP